jgi:hypothetical protein
MEYELPWIGTLYKKGCQVKKVIDILFNKKGPPDIIYLVPGRKYTSGQWYPFGAEWVRDATVIE